VKYFALKHRTLLWVLCAVCFTVGIQGLLESQFENEILRTVAQQIEIKSRGKSEVAKIDTAIRLCHFLQERRTLVLGSHSFESFKANTFRSSLQSFYIGVGACGYYSLFASRVFQKLGYKPKIVQQRVNGRWGAHITLALPMKTKPKMILVDPLYQHVFRDSSGELCSLAEVQKNWSYHQGHIPSDYNPIYNYQGGWRHTNWDKYGFVSRFAYHMLCWSMGAEKANLLSARMWIIDPYRVQSVVSFLLGGYIIGLLVLGGILGGRGQGRIEENGHEGVNHQNP
jgi:hypothetical protein